MTLLRLFADHLLPVLLVAGAGYALAAALKLETRAFTAVAFNLFAPCLIFQTLLDSHVPAETVLRMGGFTVLALAAPAAIAFAIALWRRWPRPLTSAVVLCALLPNAGNYGLSANLLAFGADGLTYASLFFVVSSIVTYTAGVMIASLGRTDLRSAALGLTRVPALWAVVGALALRELHATLPAPAAHAVSLLAQACIPTFLVILGIQLRGANLRGPLRPMLLASGLRLAGGAAAGLVLAPALGLTGAARQAAVLQSAMPTAVITTIIAIEYDVEPALVASVVLLTTLLSPFTLTPLLAALQ